jgi:hypothetical protein
VITFYTRKYDVGTDYPDRLEVRLSTNGASTNVGTGAGAFGDFSTLLLSINPTLVVGGYPRQWTQYTITISGLPAPSSGRMAFRYFVTNGGPTGANSDYIGIDEYRYTPYVCPAFTMTPGGALTGGSAGTAYSTTLTQTGALGAPSYAVTAGALPPGLTLSASGTISGTPTATGTFNFTATVSDASGCSGSQSYSITIICPSNPITFSSFPALCSNGSDYVLVEGSPAGGTYSGTGVTSGMFDPSNGSQTINYDYTDPYGCAHSSNQVITVNDPPVVTLATQTPVCLNSGDVTLSGATPAGGAYSGTNVAGGMFSPIAAGTTDVIYTYTDVNGCTEDDTTSITVNDLPVVTMGAVSSLCVGSSDVTLSGGAPVGGTYSGANVSGGMFSPVAVGTSDVIYTYVDANGCAEDDTTSITVNDLPVVTMGSVSSVCMGSADIALNSGSPAGGTYSGTNVAGSMFSPVAAGTTDIIYTYMDANGCSEDDTTSVQVYTLPSVALDPFSNVCVSSGTVTLSGGTPASGTYSGTNVTAGTFDPVATGTFSITYTYTDSNGCTDSATQSITVDPCVGLPQNTAVSAVKYFPNPNTGMFTLEFTQQEQSDMTIHITDIQGKVVLEDQRSGFSGVYSKSFDLGAFAKGVYTMEIRSGKKSSYYKIVVQ